MYRLHLQLVVDYILRIFQSFQPLSARGVVSKARKLLVEAAGVFRGYSFINSYELLLDVFITFPFNLYYIFTFPLYILCPLGIVVLLKIIRTNSSNQPIGSEDSPRIAKRILATLQSWRRGLTSSVGEVFEKWFTKIFQERGFIFFLGWFLLFPIIFFFLLLFVVFSS